MYNANIESAAQREVNTLRKEVEVLTSQHTTLTKRSLRASPLMQRLSKTYGFGVARKLAWVDFKLKFKQEQLAACELQSAGETAQQKMERMIAENPSELEPHIRHAYQPLIAAEQ